MKLVCFRTCSTPLLFVWYKGGRRLLSNSSLPDYRFVLLLSLMMFLNFFNQETWKISMARVILLSILMTFPLGVVSNQCVMNGIYLNMTKTTTEIVNRPENATLQDVGNKKCGFKITGDLEDRPPCVYSKIVEFVAVEVKTDSGDFCSFWNDHMICVCSFFGCNSVSGTLYETLIKSFYSSHEDEVVGEDETSKMKPDVRNYYSECILAHVETIFKGAIGARGPTDKLDTNQLDKLKNLAPWMFPSQNRVAELVRQGGKGTSSIAPSTATSAHSTTTRAAAPAAAVKEEKKQSAGTFARMSLALNIVLFLVVLALMAALIVAIVCLRRGKNDKGKTMWVSESKSSMAEAAVTTQRTMPNSDYFAAPSPSNPSARVTQSPVMVSDKAVPSPAPSPAPSVSPVLPGPSPTNGSVMAVPTPQANKSVYA